MSGRYWYDIDLCPAAPNQINVLYRDPHSSWGKILYSKPDQSKFAFEGKQELELSVAGPRGILLL
jgi:hypothetical protein